MVRSKLSGEPAPNPVPKHKSTQWDFKPVAISTTPKNLLEGCIKDEHGIMRDKDGLQPILDVQYCKKTDELEQMFDEYGAQGFEPCMTLTFPGNTFVFLIFKREKV